MLALRARSGSRGSAALGAAGTRIAPRLGAVRALGAALALCLLCAGCENATRTPGPLPARVRVTAAAGGAPQAGVKLLWMDLESGRALSPPFTTGADGLWTATLPGTGRFQLLAYPGAGRGVFALPGVVVPAESLRRGGDGRTARDTLALTVTTWTGTATADRLPRISGTVVDGQTGAPLAGAFVGTPLSPFLDDFAGTVGVDEDVSDVAGRFHVAGIPFASDPDRGTIVQIRPLLVTHEGYLPAAWTYEPPTGSVNLDITGVTIALAPVAPDAASGSLRGRVLFDAAPVGGVDVGVSFYGVIPPGAGSEPGLAGVSATRFGAGRPPGGPAPTAALIPGRVARTDAAGRFAISGLAPGRYVIHPGFAQGDGWVFPGAGAAVTVAAGAQTEAGDRRVVRTILPVRPQPGATLADTLPYAWVAVAEADSYAVFIDGHWRGTVAAPGWPPPAGPDRAPGPHLLQVVAVAGADSVVGAMEYGVRFLLAPMRSAR